MAVNINNESGMASLETICLLVLFLLLTGYSMGSFGIIHTGILNSIHARTYAFETFRHRTNLAIFRTRITEDGIRRLDRLGYRYHSIRSENSNEGVFHATERPLSVAFLSDRKPDSTGGAVDHNELLASLDPALPKKGVSPVWVMTLYGICLNAGCGD